MTDLFVEVKGLILAYEMAKILIKDEETQTKILHKQVNKICDLCRAVVVKKDMEIAELKAEVDLLKIKNKRLNNGLISKVCKESNPFYLETLELKEQNRKLQQQIKELKPRLISVCQDIDICLAPKALEEKEKLQQRVDKLTAELKEFNDSYKQTVNEYCKGGVSYDTDERVHCTCVPALRAEIADLDAEVKELKEELAKNDWEYLKLRIDGTKGMERG